MMVPLASVDTVAGRTAVYQVADGELVAVFDDVKDFDGGAEEGFGVFADEGEVGLATFDFAEGADVAEVVSEDAFEEGDVFGFEGGEPVVYYFSVHGFPLI